MWNYYYSEAISGEEFLVSADSLEEADMIAEAVCEDIADAHNDGSWDYDMRYHGIVSDWEAEIMGLDTY